MGPFRARSAPGCPRVRQEFRRDAHDAPVAQLDRAPDYESGGREFEISPGAPVAYTVEEYRNSKASPVTLRYALKARDVP